MSSFARLHDVCSFSLDVGHRDVSNIPAPCNSKEPSLFFHALLSVHTKTLRNLLDIPLSCLLTVFTFQGLFPHLPEMLIFPLWLYVRMSSSSLFSLKPTRCPHVLSMLFSGIAFYKHISVVSTLLFISDEILQHSMSSRRIHMTISLFLSTFFWLLIHCLFRFSSAPSKLCNL